MMVVAFTDHVGARLDQQPDDREIGGLGGKVQGIGVVAVVSDVNVGAMVQQQPYARDPVLGRGLVQRGLLLELDAARVEQIGMGVEQAAEIVGRPSAAASWSAVTVRFTSAARSSRP